MKIDHIHSAIGSPLEAEAAFLHLEQSVNNHARATSWDLCSDVNYRYSPEYGRPFELAGYARELGDLAISYAAPDDSLRKEVIVGDKAWCFSHPDTLAQEVAVRDALKVSSTSSTRTVLTHERSPNYFVKTSLPRRHFLFDRKLTPLVVASSIAISADLEQAAASQEVSWAFLPESIGISSVSHSQIFREFTPRPVRQEPTVLVPGFALYSRDLSNPDDPTLLEQLIERHRANNPAGYLLDTIIGPIQDTWAEVLRKRGLLLEMHGQNTVFELTQQNLERPVVRDFHIYSDGGIRAERGLAPLANNTIEPVQRSEQWTLCYDYFIGRLFLRHLVAGFLESYPKYSQAEIEDAIAQRFRQYHGDIASIMPADSTYRLSHDPHQVNGKPINIPKPPVYR